MLNYIHGSPELPSWEYLQKTMARAGLGMWRLRRTGENLGDLQFVADHSFLTLLGYARESLPLRFEQYLEECLNPDDAARVVRQFKERLEPGGSNLPIRYRLRHSLRHGLLTGEWHWMDVFGEMTAQDEQGRPIEFSGCIIDIHEVTIARLELEASEAALKAEKKDMERRIAEQGRLLDDIRRSIEELMDGPGSRQDAVQKDLREDMKRRAEILAVSKGRDDESFSRYLTNAFKFISNELAWYKAILDTLPFPTSVLDLDRRWTYLNQPAARAMGGRTADYLGRHYAEGWRDYQDSSELDDSDDPRIRTFTRHLQNPRRVFSGQNALLEDNHGQEIGYIETFTDITQTQEAVERTRLMLDATPLACGFFKRNGSLVDCNLAAAALLGFPSKKSFLDNFQKTIPPLLPNGRSAIETFQAGIDQAFQEEQSFLTEMVFLCEDGAEIPGEMFFRRVEWRDEYMVLGYFRDLRSLRATQEKLERERLLLKDILDGCPVPFAILANGTVRFSSPFAKTDLGLEVGASLAGLTVDAEEMADLECEMASRKEVNWQPLRLRKPDGSISENLLNAYPAGFEGGQAIMAWLMDVTELRRHERELSAARDLAMASTRAKSEFLANISHEIYTPMNAIIGFTKLMLETDLSSQQYDFAINTDAAAGSLLHLINDILDFSKLESGKLEMVALDFDLRNFLANTADLVSDKIRGKDLEFMVRAAPDTPVGLVGDEFRLHQCLNNLLDNAVKFTERGEISLSVEPVTETGDQVTLRFLVRDTGIGIENWQMATIYDPFTQADTSFTRRYAGSGLGLAICKSLVDLMGGDIWVESEPGRGSTFGFTASFGRHNPGERLINRQACFIGLCALVVDDNSLSRAILEEYLMAFGFEVSSAASGEEALEFLNRARDQGRRLDLVIMDCNMPGWDGLETTRRLNDSTPPDGRPAIIMITVHSKLKMLKSASEVGIKTVLEKPPSVDALKSVLTSIFSCTSPPEGGSQKKSARPAEAPEAAKIIKHLAGAQILLVEDNEVNQIIAQKVLTKVDLNVSLANNGQEALEMVMANDYDLVLMDIQMPVMDGLTATREIRRLEKGAFLPIVALTAHSSAEDREKSLDAGMNDHLTKPLNIEKLFRCLIKWIKTGQGAASA